MTAAPSSPALAERAGWRRRMASLVYESLLVIAIVFLATLLFPGAASGRLPDWGRHALAGYIVAVLGGYFAWFWSRGQTLAMRAWRLRLVDETGVRVRWPRALVRYIAALVLIAPGVVSLIWWREHRDSVPALAAMIVTLATLMWPLLDAKRRAPYDLIAGTRLVRLLDPKAG